jgi:hypothetical protein
MRQISKEQDYYLKRHGELMSMEESSARRIITFNIIQIVVAVGIGYLQLRLFISFLKRRKII